MYKLLSSVAGCFLILFTICLEGCHRPSPPDSFWNGFDQGYPAGRLVSATRTRRLSIRRHTVAVKLGSTWFEYIPARSVIEPRIRSMYFEHAFRAPSETFHSRKTLIDRYFKLAENQTTIKQEMLGGLTTFVTMAYIIVVNPQILAQAGMPPEGVLFATCILRPPLVFRTPARVPCIPGSLRPKKSNRWHTKRLGREAAVLSGST